MDIDFLRQTTGNVYWKDLKGAYRGCNQEFAEFAGFKSPADLIGKTDRELFLSRFGETNVRYLEEVDQQVMTENITRVLHEIGVDAQDNAISFLTKKIPLRDINNNIIGVMGTSIDLSHLAHMQADIINYSMGNLFWKDLHGRFLGCNKAFANEIGFNSPQEVIGKTDYDLKLSDPSLIEKVMELDQEIINTGKEVVREEIGANSKGELRAFLSKKGPLRDNQGNIIGVIGTAIDITQQKRAERIKTEFLQNMRHDIRTPLSGIMGFAQLIKDEVKDPKISQYADNMMASSQALMNLLNGILEAIQITSGRIPHLKKKFNLKTVLTSILDLEKSKADKEHLALTLEFDKKIPSLLVGDDLRIHRIILELVSNALKFTPRGSVLIKAELVKKINRNLRIKISVTDTGIGIPEDKQNEVFAQFTRLTPSQEGVYSGIGLGLTIVKQYIKDLEGEVDIDSTPNEGTTFTINFPIKESLLSEKDKVPAAILHTQPLLTSHKKIKILLVEDQPMPAQVATELLKKMGCEVDHAKTGQSGILHAKSNQYDLILMDIGLPDVNGNQVTEEIRKWEQPQNEYTPIIGLTAHVGPENKRQSIEAGMDAVFSKPLMKDMAVDIFNAFIYKTKVMVMPTQEAKANNKIIDLNLGATIVGKDTAFAKDMIKTLVGTFPDELKKLKKAYAKKDWSGIYDIAHRINGGVSYCGTPRLQKASSTLQNYLMSGKTKDCETLYQKLLDEIAAVTSAFKKL
jgi:two-component system aerobic respiration control sensor histidine kinase ArcB